jgi:phage tail protein X
MSNIRDDYLKFRVDDDGKSGDTVNSLIKILVIILLILLLIVLGAVAYKFLFKSEDVANNQTKKVQPIKQVKQKNTTSNVVKAVTNTVESEGNTIKKEEIALIVKSILAQMNQKKQNNRLNTNQIQTTASKPVSKKQKEINDENKVDDATLLSNLSSADVDNVKEEDIDLSSLDNVDSNRKIENKNKKEKADNFNKVIINKNELATKDDLSKLYAKLNQIMENDKTKIKSSDYVSKIKKETKVRKNAMRIITVRRGDTLSLIAKRAYGNPMMYSKIFAANPDLIKNPNMIFPGQKLRVPK